MKAIERWTRVLAPLALAAAMAAATALTGCGTPGAPLPPSLKLPDPVTNLAASRTGNQVALTWTMPKKNTDKLLIKGNIPVRICRKEGSGVCQPVPGDLAFAPGTLGAFTETLPPALATGAPRPLTYFIELRNSKGRSAGLSNGAAVLAGEAPAPVTGLSGQVRQDGVVLRWTADAAAEPATVIRLHRKLLTPQGKGGSAGKPPSQPGILAPEPEPVEQSLLVDDAARPGRSLDKSIRFGQTYEYRAQRVARVEVAGQTLELPGPISDPIRVEALDIFPPATPNGLAAVATAADPAAGPSIDLSWLPGTEADLSGYAVYRREGDGDWQRISPPQPVVGPAFHDPNVQPGHTYRYAVTAIDQLGHESPRSAEAEETIPNP
jgi:hypothetical protein